MPLHCCSLKLEPARWDCLAATTLFEIEVYCEAAAPHLKGRLTGRQRAKNLVFAFGHWAAGAR